MQRVLLASVLFLACAGHVAPVAAPCPTCPTCPAPVSSATTGAAVTSPTGPSPSPARETCDAPALPAVTEETAACPNLATLAVVHRWQPPASPAAPCTPPTWVMTMRVGVDPAPYFTDTSAESTEPSVRLLSSREAEAASLAMSDTPIWIFPGDNTPPCQAAAGRAWASYLSAGGGMFVELARAVHGCSFPANAEGPFYALRAAQRPTACRYRAMSAPDHRTPQGAAMVRSRTIHRECVAPGCRSAWQRRQFSDRGASVEDLQALYVYRRPGVEADCSWPYDLQHMVTFTPRAGQPWVRLVTDLHAAGVFTSARGIEGLVTEATGRYEVFRLAVDAEIDVRDVGPSAHGSWYVPNEEDSDPLSIAPSCL